MNKEFIVDFLWIPSELGGHSSAPYDGMRLSIRWQKYIDAHIKKSNDVECKVINFDKLTFRGRMMCRSFSELSADWLMSGNLVELMSGYRVISIGKIISS